MDPFPLDLSELATEGMSPVSIGILTRLLLYAWEHGSIPRNQRELEAITGSQPDVLMLYWSEIAHWLRKDREVFRCPRLDRARARRESLSKKRSRAGLKGAQTRWNGTCHESGDPPMASAIPGESHVSPQEGPPPVPSGRAPPKPGLRDLVIRWNGLPDSITTRRVRLNPIGVTYRRAWNSATHSQEVKHLLRDLEPIFTALERTKWLHAKPFLTLEWLLSRNRSTTQWNLVNLLEGYYERFENAGRGTQSRQLGEEYGESGRLPVL